MNKQFDAALGQSRSSTRFRIYSGGHSLCGLRRRRIGSRWQSARWRPNPGMAVGALAAESGHGSRRAGGRIRAWQSARWRPNPGRTDLCRRVAGAVIAATFSE
jgi:hypothetical protein